MDKTIFGLCTGQATAGHEIGLFCTSNKPEIPISGVSVKNFRRSRNPFSISPALLHDLTAFCPEILHFHSGFIPRSTTLAKWARRRRLPYVVTPNGNCSAKLLRRRPAIKVPFWHLCEKPFLNQAAFLHAVGDRKEIEDLAVHAPIVDALNGIDLSSLPTSTNPDRILQKLPHWVDRKIFVFVGRLDIQQKGLDLLMQAFADAIRHGLNGSLLLVGPDWQGGRAALEKMRRKLHLEDRVSFWGGAYGTEKFDLVAGANYFVHPSRWEGMSFAVIEALACGKICLVTPAADPGGLIQKYAAGSLTAPTAEAISQGLRQIAETPEGDLDVIRQNACALVRTELDWSKITRLVVDGYKRFGGIK